MVRINYGLVISVIGIIGLVLVLGFDNLGKTIGKVPGSIFFLFILTIGIILQTIPEEKIDEWLGTNQAEQGYA